MALLGPARLVSALLDKVGLARPPTSSLCFSHSSFLVPGSKTFGGKILQKCHSSVDARTGLPAASESRDQTFLPASGKRIGEVREDRSFVRSGFLPFENFRLKIEFYLLSMDPFVGELKFKNLFFPVVSRVLLNY